MTEKITFLQKLKKEISELTTEQILSYFLQLLCLSLSFAAIYWYQTGIDFEVKFSRNTIDHFTIILLGLVGFLFFRDWEK